MTSIEWLIKELKNEMGYGRDLCKSDKRVLDEIVNEAKEMHKQEMAETFKQSRQALIFEKHMPPVYENLEQYYNETFVSKGSDDRPMERKLLKSGFVDVVPQQETLYTEEQVREAMDFARGHHKMTDTQFIQSLKQPKQ